MTAPASFERIQAALCFIPPGGHDERVKMAAAVKSELGEAGRELWDNWRGDRGGDEAASVWKSVRETGAIGIGTLFYEAKANGWADDGDHPKPTPEAIAERKRLAAERAATDAAEIERERAETATKAGAIWKAATEARADHPYLLRKQVAPTETLREIGADDAAAVLGYTPKAKGEPLTGRLLVVPIKQGERLSSLELIDGTGRKTALSGRGTKAGGYWATERLPDGDGAGLTLLIGEGVATVLSAAQATGHPAIAALSSGNLLSVAKAMRDRYPAATLAVLADLVKATGKPDPHAIEAARAVGGWLAVPDFGNDRPEAATDFNDLAVWHGIEAVAEAINGSVAPAGGEPQADAGGEAVALPKAVDRPCYRVFDDWLTAGMDKLRPGVWHFGNDKDGNETRAWLCSPLHIEAVTFDGAGNNFGRLLRFKNSVGKWRVWAMPMELLRGAGDELRGELLSMGAELDPTKARNLLPHYLQWKTPKRRIHCATQTGWHGRAFVLPGAVIGPDADAVIFQSAERHDEHTQAGSLEGWRDSIATLAIGNPLLMLALSAAFAGPLLGRCNAEGGGVHFVGDSSTGKTTAIEAACSVWGGANYRRSWRATANGIEGAAVLFNDCLLALDEISEADPRQVGEIVYMLGNGRGKQRAGRTGSARGVMRWRCVVLSSGERTIETTMKEGGHRTKAGQAVRLLDIPAARAFGAWDALHNATSAAGFSDAIKRAAVANHGMAGRAFLERLTHDERDFCALLESAKAADLFATEGEGQDRRAAGRFALIGLAGELATEYDLTGWAAGDALNAAAACLKLWQSNRGRGNSEARQIAERLAGFLERHGDGRFSDVAALHDVPVRDRAGWWRGDGEAREYLLTAEAMREALTGFDFKRALDALEGVGALAASGKERAKPYKIGGRVARLYAINPERLGGDHA